MNDINLLPEELREDERRLSAQLSGSKPPVAWHVPNSSADLAAGPATPALHQGGIKSSGRPAGLEKDQAKAQSVELPKVKFDLKPQALIFDLDAEAKNSPNPEQLLVQEKNRLSSKVDSKAASWSREKPAGPGLMGRLFSKKNAKGRIISNKPDRPGQFGSSKTVDVNLIPEGSDLLPNKHFYPYFLYAGLGGAVVIGALFLGLVLYQQKIVGQDQEAAAKVSTSEMIYNQLKAKEESLSVWSKKVNAIQTLFDNHVYWTKFFEALQSVTTPDVYYSDINTAVDGTVTLSAGAGSYLAVAKQYLAYQQADALIKEVHLSDIEGDPTSGEITFSVNLQFWPEVFFLTLNGD